MGIVIFPGAEVADVTIVPQLGRPVDVLRGYIRRADLFREHAGAAFL